MHLLLDSSFEHADSKDLQPSTKDMWISYQNCLRALHIIIVISAHWYYTISGLPDGVLWLLLGSFFILANRKTFIELQQ